MESPKSDIRKWFRNQFRWHVIPFWNKWMKLLLSKKAKLTIKGRDNRVQSFRSSGKSRILVQGDNNRVSIDQTLNSHSVIIEIRGNNNNISISEGVRIDNINIYISGVDCSFEIAKETYVSSAQCIVGEENSRMFIGERCMIASGVEIRTSDSHGIFELGTKCRINHAKDVKVENDVWLANQVLLLKGAVVPEGSVVGARSVVTGRLAEKNAVYAGNPARLIRRNALWGWVTDHFPEHKTLAK
jgi:acetyltransferase-like isoleucine patch superfamily enzyme